MSLLLWVDTQSRGIKFYFFEIILVNFRVNQPKEKLKKEVELLAKSSKESVKATLNNQETWVRGGIIN